MNHSYRLSAATFALALVCGYACANDTTARVGSGGLVLTRSDQIRMLQETLEISTKTVRVAYRFKNYGEKGIRTIVAFPMPEFGWNAGQSAIDENVRPLRPFSVLVDGKSVPVGFERKAVVDGRDVSPGLRKAGLSDKQIFETFGDCNLEGCPFTAKQSTEIARLVGKASLYPAWKVAEIAYWEQSFPAGVEVQVQHEYPPFVGMSFSAPYQSSQGHLEGLPTGNLLGAPAEPNEACTDEGASQALAQKIKRLSADGARRVWVTLNDVEYVLGTGRNWRGPIGDFTLRIRKDTADQVISLCFPGQPKRIDARTIEFHATEFTPQDRLIVHFYTVSVEGQ